MESVTVRVPATTANLAAGFDTLGCALSLYNKLSFHLSDHLSISGCPAEYQNVNNLAYQGFRCVYSSLHQAVPAVSIDIDASIPVSRGLGSSAAMLAGGALAASLLLGAGLSPHNLLDITAPLEGHPDNLAPALLGGLTASMMSDGKVYTVRYVPYPALRFVALSPDFTLSTSKARQVLPKTVSFSDAVYNLSHVAVLLRALETGDRKTITAALDDRLHQTYRIPLIDEYEDVRKLGMEEGALGVCISGAGPTVLCLTDDALFSERIRNRLYRLCHQWTVYELDIDRTGACPV